MDRLQAMRVFTRIVELGSFTRAADDLGLPRATLTHTIKRLEEHVGAHLLQRTTRRVRATQDGEVYYHHCVRLLADLDAVEADFREAAMVPKGKLRIDLASSLARNVLIPALPDFFARYPQIELDIGTSDRFIDLVQEGVDCVLRAGELPDSTMVGRRVASLSQVTVASAAYVRRHGAPRSLADLQNGHVAVNWASPTTRRISALEFMAGRHMHELVLPAQVTVSGTEAYLSCCEAGLGIAQFPRYRIVNELADGRLIELLANLPPPAFPVSVLYQSQRHIPLRLRVFIDWVAELLMGLP